MILCGRVGSLFEVGIGFYFELMGCENVFLNGGILGMGCKDIWDCFDEIVDFVGVEWFFEFFVKWYLSGMWMWFVFVVVVYFDFEILIVDEVFVVGDLLF